MTASLSRCARCGSTDLEDRLIEKLIRSGDDAVALDVLATVCRHCGERYLPPESIKALDAARRDLKRGTISRYRELGRLLAP